MITCYEHLRKKKTNNFNRLNGYFNALKNDQTDNYHKHHGRNSGLNEEGK